MVSCGGSTGEGVWERAMAVDRSAQIEEEETGGEKRSEPWRRRRAWARLL